MNILQQLVERIILASRYVLVVFYVGLAFALLLYAGRFAMKLQGLTEKFWQYTDEQFLLGMLNLIDAALVAGLVVMVMLSSYDTFVSRLDSTEKGLSALHGLDPGKLKIKVAAAIVAISSIHLLQVFLETTNYQDRDVFWRVVIHLAFIASAVFMGVLDRMTEHKAQAPAAAKGASGGTDASAGH